MSLVFLPINDCFQTMYFLRTIFDICYYYLGRFIRKSANTNKETRLTKIITQEDYAVKTT